MERGGKARKGTRSSPRQKSPRRNSRRKVSADLAVANDEEQEALLAAIAASMEEAESPKKESNSMSIQENDGPKTPTKALTDSMAVEEEESPRRSKRASTMAQTAAVEAEEAAVAASSSSASAEVVGRGRFLNGQEYVIKKAPPAPSAEELAEEAQANPDTWAWSYRFLQDSSSAFDETVPANFSYSGEVPSPIQEMGKKHPLTLLQTIRQRGYIYSMAISPDARMLAACSSLGQVCIYALDDFSLVQELQDSDEKHIEQFYHVTWSPNSKYVYACGVRQNREQYDMDEQDNSIVPNTPIKCFDVVSGHMYNELSGHTEEALSLQTVTLDGKHYLISSSEDGYVYKHPMDDDWAYNTGERSWVYDMTTSVAAYVTLIPGTGQRLVAMAADNAIKILDLKQEAFLQAFDDVFTLSTVSIQFVYSPLLASSLKLDSTKHRLLLVRGCHALDEDGELSKPNELILYKLTLPEEAGDEFALEQVRSYSADGYVSNQLLMEDACTSTHVASPTQTGHVYIFDLLTGLNTLVLKDHSETEVRCVCFHPTKPYMFTSGDDGTINVYVAAKK